MNIRSTAVEGVWIIEPARNEDGRGWFSRTHCAEGFAGLGLAHGFAQCSTIFNHRRGTLRGLHFQAPPASEAKLVRCTRGAAFDVAVDLRTLSPTRGQWVSVELSADNGRAIYIAEGCAHGFQTLLDGTELFFQSTVAYRPELGRGVCWNDSGLSIPWPVAEPIMSERDRLLPSVSQGFTAMAVPLAAAVNGMATLRADHG